VTVTVHPSETSAKRSLSTLRTVEVALVQWPAERNRREELRRTGQPRLLLVERGAPPIPDDVLEDWIRLPADDLDLRVRVEALRRRTDGDVAAVPELDHDGVLRLGDRWVSLPPVESRLTGALLARFGAVVSRDVLTDAGWPGGSPGRNALDVHVLRLRRRLSPLRLAIRTIRSRGYLLERTDGGAQAASGATRPASRNGMRRRSAG
jgi:DNA-binding winged helix-turn-helix (wHTH) protein